MAKQRTVGEAIIARLADWGVDTVFGRPGDGTDGLVQGLRRAAGRVRFVLVHHEEAAALMAVAHAKATGRLGVCLATSAPGGVRLAAGLYDAKLDHVPVLALTGAQGPGAVPLDRLLADVAEHDEAITGPARAPALVDHAVRTALARRGVAHLSVPGDVQAAPAGDAPATAPVWVAPPVRPADDDLHAAADLLNVAERPAILAGAGARRAGALVELTADVLGAPIVTSLPGKAVVPEDSQYTLGVLGPFGTAPGEELMAECDALLMVGTDFPYPAFLPGPGRAHVVQIEAEAARAGTRIPTDVPLVGDAAATLESLLPRLRRRKNGKHLQRYQLKMRDWRERTAAGPQPGPARRLAVALDRVAARDAVLCCDPGPASAWAARHWPIAGRRELYLSGTLASPAPGLPYAIAVQHEYPGRQCLALVGADGFAMLMAEFDTAARYGLPITVILGGPGLGDGLGPDAGDAGGSGHFGGLVPAPGRAGGPVSDAGGAGGAGPDYAAWARGCGGFGARVSTAAALEQTLRDALAFDGPALVEVALDADAGPDADERAVRRAGASPATMPLEDLKG